MKIKVARYTSQLKRKCNQLTIGIGIELPNGGSLNTSAKVQLYPLSFLVGRSPDVAFGMLYLSSIVYAIDRSVDRSAYSIDGWSRVFDVDVMLPGYERFHAIEESINAMLDVENAHRDKKYDKHLAFGHKGDLGDKVKQGVKNVATGKTNRDIRNAYLTQGKSKDQLNRLAKANKLANRLSK